MTTNLEEQTVVVRRLRPDDLEAVVALDAKNTGRKRDEYFKVKLEQNLAETGIQVSLAAELDGAFVGFLLARVFYGEFGTMEQVAVLDTFARCSGSCGRTSTGSGSPGCGRTWAGTTRISSGSSTTRGSGRHR